MYNDIADKINIIKEEQEISLRKLARIMGLQVGNLSRFVQRDGIMSISLEAIYRLCKYFDISIDSFLDTPVNEFSLDVVLKPQTTDKDIDIVYTDMIENITDIYQKLDREQQVWFKVSVCKYIDKIVK